MLGLKRRLRYTPHGRWRGNTVHFSHRTHPDSLARLLPITSSRVHPENEIGAGTALLEGRIVREMGVCAKGGKSGDIRYQEKQTGSEERSWKKGTQYHDTHTNGKESSPMYTNGYSALTLTIRSVPIQSQLLLKKVENDRRNPLQSRTFAKVSACMTFYISCRPGPGCSAVPCCTGASVHIRGWPVGSN